MPQLTSPEIDVIRSHPHYVAKYLSVNPKNLVYSGQADGTLLRDNNTGGVYGFMYTGGSGTLGDIEINMLVEIGTTPGAKDVGTTRIRTTPTSDTIYIEETALGALPIETNHYFSVYESFLPDVTKIRLVPRKTNGSTFFNDFTEYHNYNVPYTNQNSNIEPKSNITEQSSNADKKIFPIKFAGFVDGYRTTSEETYRTVTLSGSQSFAIATGASISSYLWDVGDGTISVGTDSDEEITVQFPVGFRYITLEVTDSLSTTSLRRVPIWVHDDTYPPISHRTSSDLSRGFSIIKDVTKEGREMDFEIFGEVDSATETEIPVSIEVCYWEEVEFDLQTPPEQYRYSYLGWVLQDSVSIRQDGTYKLETGNITSWLKNLTGFGTQITDPGNTPDKWFEMENISPDRMVHYLLREYTTTIPLINLYFSNISKAIQSETAKRASIWQQLKDVMQANFAFALSDSGNQVFLKKHPSYPLEADPTPTNILEIEADDWSDDTNIELSTRQFEPVGRVDGTGAFWVSGNNEPDVVASRAPGKVTSRGSGTESTPFQRLAGATKELAQDELNILTGHHYARKNTPTPTINLTMLGNYDVFEPAWMETVSILYTGDNIRNFSLSGAETYLVTQVSVTHSSDQGSFPKSIRLQLEPVTEGEPGETIVIPTGDWVDNPFWDFFWDVNPLLPDFDFNIDFDESLTYEFEGEKTGFAIFPVENKWVDRSFSFGNEYVSYDDITPAPFGAAGYTLGGIACQYSGTNVTCRAIYWQGTTGRIYVSTDAEQSVPTWSLEETFSITGGAFNGAIKITASDDPTVDLWAVTWLTESGIYITRRKAGSWQTAAVVNSAAFTDPDWEDKYVGTYIDGTTVYVGGRVSTTGYDLFQATDLGSFSAVTSGIFPNCISDITVNLDGDVYASCYGTTTTVNSTNVPLVDSVTLNSYDSAVLPEASNSWGLTAYQGGETNDASVDIDKTSYPPVIPQSIDTLEMYIAWSERWEVGANIGATWTYTGGAVATVDWTLEIVTSNLDTFNNSGSFTLQTGDVFTRFPPSPGPRYPYIFTKSVDALDGINPAIPSDEPLEIQEMTLTISATTTSGNFHRGSVSAFNDSTKRVTVNHNIAESSQTTSIEKPDSRFARITDPLGSPVVADIRPPEEINQGCPDRPFQIAPDWGDADNLHAIGRVDEDTWQHYVSFDKGSNWNAIIQQTTTSWEMLNTNITLEGGENELDLSLGSEVNDRLGNIPELHNRATPFIGPGYVLFAG